MTKQLNYDSAVTSIERLEIKILQTQKIFITKSLGYVLAKDIIANENSPKYPTSSMDGYAIKFENQSKNKLKITDFNPAGCIVQNSVSDGTCIKTFTGSLMPDGSDTLIPIENVTVVDNEIIINKEVVFGFAVRSIGENYQVNEVLIKKGSVIGFAEIGVMASLNIIYVEVYKKPIVGVCSTGSEILDLGEGKQNESQIRSSNHLTIEALALQNGCETVQLGVVKDDKNSITEALKNGLALCDVLITTGGVSVGDYDFVKDVVKEELGAEIIFQGVNIKPGQHIILARIGDKFIVSLPGFAYSSTVTFILFALPLIFKMRCADEKLKIVNAILEHNLPKKANKAIFTACNIKYQNGDYLVNTIGKKDGSSGILTNMLGNTALIIQNDEIYGSKQGDTVEVILLRT